MIITRYNAETEKSLEVEIYEITKEESDLYSSSGKAYGFNLAHCLLMTANHTDDAAISVRYYRYLDHSELDFAKETIERQPGGVGVEFYKD